MTTPIWITLPLLVWLGLICWFDLYKREVPNVWWTGVPFALVLLYRSLQPEGWRLALGAIVLLALSERKRLPAGWQKVVWLATPLVLAGIGLLQKGALVVFLLMVMFWLLFELGQLGGADSLVALTLLALWPDSAVAWTLLWLVAGGTTILIARLILRRKGGSILPGLPAAGGAAMTLILLNALGAGALVAQPTAWLTMFWR